MLWRESSSLHVFKSYPKTYFYALASNSALSDWWNHLMPSFVSDERWKWKEEDYHQIFSASYRSLAAGWIQFERYSDILSLQISVALSKQLWAQLDLPLRAATMSTSNKQPHIHKEIRSDPQTHFFLSPLLIICDLCWCCGSVKKKKASHEAFKHNVGRYPDKHSKV